MTEHFKELVLDGIDDKYLYEALQCSKKGLHKKTPQVNIFVKLVACLALTFCLAISSLSAAIAMGNIPAYELLYNVFPDIALRLLPVHKISVDNDIRMAVEGISIEGNTAYIYISMEDLRENRIDSTTDLFDSYSINTTADQIGNCTFIDFDETTKKAMFLITVQNLNNTPINHDIVNFSVSKFLSGKAETNIELTDISLTTLSEMDKTQAIDDLEVRGYSSTEDISLEELPKNYLCEDYKKSFIPVSGVSITNYGMIDHKLHIQVCYEDILRFDNHGYVYLLDSQGQVTYPTTSTSFWDASHIDSYEEYVFDIDADFLSNYHLYGDFSTCENLVIGNWNISFNLHP